MNLKKKSFLIKLWKYFLWIMTRAWVFVPQQYTVVEDILNYPNLVLTLLSYYWTRFPVVGELSYVWKCKYSSHFIQALTLCDY